MRYVKADFIDDDKDVERVKRVMLKFVEPDDKTEPEKDAGFKIRFLLERGCAAFQTKCGGVTVGMATHGQFGLHAKSAAEALGILFKAGYPKETLQAAKKGKTSFGRSGACRLMSNTEQREPVSL